MGCDIHMYVEKKVDNRWYPVKSDNPFQKGDQKPVKGYADWLYAGRNYRLFALLADVRNSGGIEPLDSPRGLPNDASKKIRDVFIEDLDGHSHSYFTLRELQDNQERFEDGFESITKKLETLAENDSDSVRILFYFDN